ncbi:MAG: DedA family protein [Acidimicrobiia bacterium]
MEGPTGEVAPRRIPLPWLITPIAVMSVAGLVADALGPKLVTEHPLLQLFLNPRNRYLLLVAPQLDATSFFLVGFIRLLLTDPLYFVLGRQYGEAALRWADDNAGTMGPVIRRVEKWFGRAAPLVVLLAPSGNMCLLAGASGMKVRLFWAMNVLGTIGRLTVFWIAGDAFRDELEGVLDWIQRYQWRLVGVTVAIAVAQTVLGRRRGTLDTPAEAEAEIERNLGDET